MGRSRVPTNVIDGLEDITALLMDTWPAIEAISEHAQRNMDVLVLARLNTLTINLAKIERYVKAARRGEYAGRRAPPLDLSPPPARPEDRTR